MINDYQVYLVETKTEGNSVESVWIAETIGFPQWNSKSIETLVFALQEIW